MAGAFPKNVRSASFTVVRYLPSGIGGSEGSEGEGVGEDEVGAGELGGGLAEA